MTDLGPFKYQGTPKTQPLAAPQAFAPAAARATPFSRADVVIDGIDHSGPSFEVRLFADRSDADASTPQDDAHGYLGSFSMFGHGFCFGDEGHCAVNARGQAETDLRDPHPLAPASKTVVVTDELKRIIAEHGPVKAITLVPIAIGTPTRDPGAADFFKYKSLRLVTYD